MCNLEKINRQTGSKQQAFSSENSSFTKKNIDFSRLRSIVLVANLHGLGMQKHVDIAFITMLLAHKGSKSRFKMQMFTCNILIFSIV